MSGVVLTLAGVAATGDEEFFSIISAGIFLLFFLSSQSPENFIFGIFHAKKYFSLISLLLDFHKKNY